MPPLAVVKTEVAPREPDHLASLLKERDARFATLEGLRRFDAMVSEAQARLDQADADGAALVSQERAALAEWAARGAHGSAPVMEHASRQAIEQRRALALSDLAAAVRQQEAVQGRVAELNGELGRIGRAIYEAKVSAVMAEVEGIEKAILDAHATMTSNLTQLRALFDALIQEKSAAENRHDDAAVTAIQAAMVRIEATREPKATPDWAAHQLAVAAWREKLR